MSACSREEHCTMKRFCGDDMPVVLRKSFCVGVFYFPCESLEVLVEVPRSSFFFLIQLSNQESSTIIFSEEAYPKQDF